MDAAIRAAHDSFLAVAQASKKERRRLLLVPRRNDERSPGRALPKARRKLALTQCVASLGFKSACMRGLGALRLDRFADIWPLSGRSSPLCNHCTCMETRPRRGEDRAHTFARLEVAQDAGRGILNSRRPHTSAANPLRAAQTDGGSKRASRAWRKLLLKTFRRAPHGLRKFQSLV